MDAIATQDLSPLERKLVERFQHGLPLCPRPYAAMAQDLGTSEQAVLAALHRLEAAGVLSRVGAVIAPHRVGWSTLAAMRVPEERLEAVAELVSRQEEVNHCYLREHAINLWFVAAAPGRDRVGRVLARIADATGLEVLDLPLERAYAIDLGFVPKWN
jgi:DNA-binding Lrp family transcriptional regulator